jgi:hypothetical protein
VKPFRRYQPMPPYAYCRDPRCRWSDPDSKVAPSGVSARQFGVSVEQAARAHVTITGHEVRLVRVQEIILRPGVQEVPGA